MGELTNAVRLELLAIGVTPTLLIGALAWWFRARLQQSLAKTLNAHTERVKLDAQREIESYKVTLIASIERQKAQAELLKAIAIKHATREYDALIELHSRLGDVPSAICAAASTDVPETTTHSERREKYQEMLVQWKRLKAAADGANIFLAADTSICLLLMCQSLHQIVHVHLGAGGKVSSEGLFTKQVPTLAELKELIRFRVLELVQLSHAD